jgi:hypothetical protein
MINAWMVTLATFATGPEVAQLQTQAALGTFLRLAGTVPDDRPGLTAQERAEYGPRKAELVALTTYLGKVREVIEIGKFDESFRTNLLVVAQQAAFAGSILAVLPEEALCWERAGLNFAAVHRRVIQQQVVSGRLSVQELRQADEAYEFTLRRYNETLARCLTSDN